MTKIFICSSDSGTRSTSQCGDVGGIADEEDLIQRDVDSLDEVVCTRYVDVGAHIGPD